jgi:hypothetical protein
MAVPYTIHAVKLGTPVIGGVSSSTFDDGINVQSPDVDGSVEARIAVALEGKPSISLVSEEVARVLAVTGAKGVDISTLSGGVVLYFKRLGIVGNASGSSHVTVTIAAGVVVVDSYGGTQGQTAKINFRVVPGNASGTNPVAIASNAALPTLQAPEVFTLGPVKLNGTAVAGVQSWNIAMAPQVIQAGDSGHAYPTMVSLENSTPTCEVSTLDLAAFSTLTAAGFVTQGATDTSLFLRAVTNGGTLVADATENHLLVQIAAGIWTRTSTGGSRAASMSFRANIIGNGTDPIVAVTPSSAIT